MASLRELAQIAELKRSQASQNPLQGFVGGVQKGMQDANDPERLERAYKILKLREEIQGLRTERQRQTELDKQYEQDMKDAARRKEGDTDAATRKNRVKTKWVVDEEGKKKTTTLEPIDYKKRYIQNAWKTLGGGGELDKNQIEAIGFEVGEEDKKPTALELMKEARRRTKDMYGDPLSQVRDPGGYNRKLKDVQANLLSSFGYDPQQYMKDYNPSMITDEKLQSLGITREDLNSTAKKYNLTPEETLRKIINNVGQ